MKDTGLRGLGLLDAAIDHIERHPETWDQGHYRCETGMCVAGWMCELAGGQWATPPGSETACLLVAEPDDAPALMNADQVAGSRVLAMDRAERLLGFSNWMGDALGNDDDRSLFGACNTLDDIKCMRDDLRAAKAPAPRTPPEARDGS